MRVAVLAAILASCLPAAAWADSIDGAWCHQNGKRMVISGPSIVTPAGTSTKGDYGRHDFTYVSPAGDPDAGTTIRMVLMGETHVRVQEGAAAPVVWERCGPSISALTRPGWLG
jgi:hypothetical protein